MSKKKPSNGKGKKLTNYERRVLKGVAKGLSQSKAATEAGYVGTRPRRSGYEVMKRIGEKAPELLERHGLTDDALIRDFLIPLMQAEKTEFVKYEGKFSDRAQVQDWNARAAGLDMVLRVRGLYKSEAENDAPSIKVVVINAENRPPRDPNQQKYVPPPAEENHGSV